MMINMSVIPDATASSTTYCITGVSTIVNISFGCALVCLNSETGEVIIKQYMEYENLEDEKEKLTQDLETTHLKFLKRDFEDHKRVKDKYQSTLGITILVLLVSILGIIFLDNFIFIGINFIAIPLGIFSFIRFQKSKEIINSLKGEILKGQGKDKAIKENIESIEKKQKTTLNSLGLASKAEFNNLQEEIRFQIYSKKEKEKSIEIFKSEIVELEREISIGKEEIDINRVDLKILLEKNLSSNIEDFEQGLNYKKIYQDSLSKLNSRREMLKRVLNGVDMEDLKNQILSYKKDISIRDSFNSVDKIKKDIDREGEEISNIRIKKSGVEERLNYLNNRIDKLVEIEESIFRREEELSELDGKRQALELAMKTIKDLSKNIHREFAPEINRSVGEIVEKITGGKYINVKVDDRLKIGVIKPDSGEMIDIESLSGGTIDQLYFSLRFGIMDSFSRKDLPLILDDCFIQYDNRRLENMMKFLMEISSQRQIILFTCHKRELENLIENNKNFNLVDLTLY